MSLVRRLEPFRLASGAVLPQAEVAYEEYGPPDAPVVLVCHGGFSHHRASGPDGYWSGLIGPGKAVDTERFRVLSPNSLGAMFGSTSPLSVNPATGSPYGPDFPAFTFEDAGRFHKAFLDSLGVSRVALALGPSMGSCQSLQLAALYPDLVERVAAIATSGRCPVAAATVHNVIINILQLDPAFHGGHYTSPLTAVKQVYLLSRLYYNHERGFSKRCWSDDPLERERRIEAFLWEGLDVRLATWDPNSIIATLRALNGYDLFQGGIERVKCPVLAVNFTTDCEFAPFHAQELGEAIGAQVHILDSDWGHLGCITEVAQMDPLVRQWLN